MNLGWIRLAVGSLAGRLASAARRLRAVAAGAALTVVVAIAAGWAHSDALMAALEELRGAPAQGEVLVGPPEVFTRERLVSDRLEQINWVNNLMRTLDEEPPGGFQGVEAVLVARSSLGASGTVGPGGDASGTRAPGAGAGAVGTPSAAGAPSTSLSDFQQRAQYRGELRNERMRAMLDDRHDVEGNTVVQLNFNATVVPTRAGRPGLAVVVAALSARDPPPHRRTRARIRSFATCTATG